MYDYAEKDVALIMSHPAADGPESSSPHSQNLRPTLRISIISFGISSPTTSHNRLHDLSASGMQIEL